MSAPGAHFALAIITLSYRIQSFIHVVTMAGILSKEAAADSAPDNAIETSSFQQDGLRKPEIEHTETL